MIDKRHISSSDLADMANAAAWVRRHEMDCVIKRWQSDPTLDDDRRLAMMFALTLLGNLYMQHADEEESKA